MSGGSEEHLSNNEDFVCSGDSDIDINLSFTIKVHLRMCLTFIFIHFLQLFIVYNAFNHSYSTVPLKI